MTANGRIIKLIYKLMGYTARICCSRITRSIIIAKNCYGMLVFVMNGLTVALYKLIKIFGLLPRNRNYGIYIIEF